MPYLGNQHNVGDHVNNFKVLDDISSHTATFDGSATSVVSAANDTIRIPEHRFIQGQRVTYTNGGGGNIGGLTTGTAYFVIYDTAFTIKLATNASNAANSTAINLSSVGSGTSHTLNAAFDGTNTKFKLTHGSGVGARLNNATQLNVAINNVVQRPNQSALTFTEGFAIEDNHKIVFKVAPTSEDIFWGSIIANTITTFDISDHKIDTFTGDGSTTEFTLTHTPANNESLMVTINGVLQHPSNASTARAYTLIASIIQFTAAPGVGDEIQVRHLGFAGATTADVSGFYGRTGNVVLTDQDDIIVNKINVGTGVTIESNGQATFVGVVTFGSGSTTIDNNVVNVGTALTLGHTQGLQFHTQNLHSTGFEVNNINASGIITASSFVGNIGGNPTFSGDATFNGSVSIGGTLTYEDVTNIDSIGIVTARDGLKVLAGGANVVGVVTATTFKGDGDFVELDVDGHTNLDNVSVAGVTTMSGALNANGNIVITSATPYITFDDTNNRNWQLNADGGNFIIKDTTDSVNRLVINSSGNVSINNDLDVDGHTNLDNVSIAGVTTMTASGTTVLRIQRSTTDGPVLQIHRTGNTSGGGPELKVTDGFSSTSPVYGFWYNSTTGIGNPAANTTSFIQGGSEKVRIASNGRVGILTVTPEARLDVYDTSGLGILSRSATTQATDTNKALKVRNNSTTDTFNVSYKGQGYFAGKVGINQSSPTEDLEVKGDQTATIYINAGQHDASTANEATLKLGFNQSHANDSIGYVKLLEAGGNSFDGHMTFGVPYNNSSTPATREALRITSSGRLIVGHTATYAVAGHYPAIQLSGNDYNSATLGIINNVNDATGAYIQLSKQRSGSPGGATIVQDDDLVGQITFTAADGTDLTSRTAEIKGLVDGTPGSNDTPGRLSFWTTADGAQSTTERLRIDSSGRLYLGSNFTGGNGDVDDLVISGTGNKGITICSTSGGNVRLTFADGLSGTAAVIGSIVYEHGSTNAMDFYTNALRMMRVDRANSTERLQIGAINNNSAGTRLVLGSGNNVAATALINTQDTNINALTLSNWDGSTTTNKVNMHFDASGIAGFDVGIPAATTAFKIANTSGGGGYLNLKTTGETMIYRSGVIQADINNSVSGHTFVSQCDDNQDGFQIYQQHGSTATRYTFACYDNRSGSKGRSFGVRGDGKTIFYGDALPSADTTHDLGSDSYTWDKFYYKNAYPEQSTEYAVTSGSYSNGQWHDTAFGRDSMGGLDLNGVYIVTAYADLYVAMGGNYQCNYTWIVGLRNQYTNQTLVNTCPLLSVTGHSTNNFGASGATVGDGIRLGTSRTPASSGGEEQIVWRPAASTGTINNVDGGRILRFRCQRIGRSSLG